MTSMHPPTPTISGFQTTKAYTIICDEYELVNRKATSVPSDHGTWSSDLHGSESKSGREDSGKQIQSFHLLRRRLRTRVLPGFLLCGLIVLFCFMTFFPQRFFQDFGRACNPNGEFVISYPTRHISIADRNGQFVIPATSYTPFTNTGMFAINMKFGRLLFWQAKFIDLAWDIVVGRGAQAILGVFTYIIFTRGLIRTVETTSVPYDTYKAITLQSNTFMGIVLMVRNLSRTGDRRAKVAMVWAIISALFVLLLPTWLSAMKGYVTDLSPYVTLPDNTTVPVERFQPLIYTIHDGARLGKGYANDTPVLAPWLQTTSLDTCNHYTCMIVPVNSTAPGGRTYTRSKSSDCQLLWAVSEYVSDYGFLGQNKTNTTIYLPSESLDNIIATPLASPSLNITATFALDPRDRNYVNGNFCMRVSPYGMTWKDPLTGNRPFERDNPYLYEAASKTIYTHAQINQNGLCAQSSSDVRYQWGFSFLLLYVFVLTLIVWIIGLWIYYFDVLLHSRLLHRDMGPERAALDLAHAARSKDLDEKDFHLIGNCELRSHVKQDLLTFTDRSFGISEPTRWQKLRRQGHSFKGWLKCEKWWLAGLFLVTTLYLVGFAFIPSSAFIVFGYFPILGVMMVISVGHETYGRWILFVVFALPLPLLCILEYTRHLWPVGSRLYLHH